MNLKITYQSKVQNGHLSKKVTNEIRRYIEGNEGKIIEISIMRALKKRSVNQNAYYWKVIVPIFAQGLKDHGWGSLSPTEVHELLKDRFAKREIYNEESGEMMIIPQSTTTFSTTRMMEYFLDIRNWAREWLGCHIPEPNEQMSIEFQP